ncbi:MAG: GMP/IMP nucleotidase [Gammaproteobacteria bacterium]|nr:GMP/IMP nucleotidase [Gammaproteobacteria bacterium]
MSNSTKAAGAVDWSQVDTVLLDMDGTLLDLHFDNRFWIEHIPRRWGEKHGLSYEDAFKKLYPVFKEKEGSLDWYSLAFWRDYLEMDIVALKQELAHLIQVLPHVEDFLQAVRDSGRRLVLVTNAHDETLEFKMALITIGSYFDAMYTSHEFGLPKEGKGFWDKVREVEPFEPARALFCDDSHRVLTAARDYGIGQVVAMRQPDTQQPARDIEDFPAILDFREIMPA